MELIKSTVSIIDEQDIFKKIELAGRTCYKSEKRITENSAKKFVSMLIKNGHLAMIEHAILYFMTNDENLAKSFLRYTYNNVYNTYIVSGNLRYFYENNVVSFTENSEIILNKPFDTKMIPIFNYDDIEKLLISEEDKNKHRYLTMRFICDRGVSHEIVRHRTFSFAMESTRYVKYNKNNMQFIEPANWCHWTGKEKGLFLSSCACAEDYYTKLMNEGLLAQDARAVLPNALKTELVITGNQETWYNFFKLRCASDAHPDCKRVADLAKELYNKKNETNY